MDDIYVIEPSLDWEGDPQDPYAVLPDMVYMAAENVEDAHMRYIQYQVCDDEDAIRSAPSGWFGCLADVEDLIACQAIIGHQLQLFRVVAARKD